MKKCNNEQDGITQQEEHNDSSATISITKYPIESFMLQKGFVEITEKNILYSRDSTNATTTTTNITTTNQNKNKYVLHRQRLQQEKKHQCYMHISLFIIFFCTIIAIIAVNSRSNSATDADATDASKNKNNTTDVIDGMKKSSITAAIRRRKAPGSKSIRNNHNANINHDKNLDKRFDHKIVRHNNNHYHQRFYSNYFSDNKSSASSSSNNDMLLSSNNDNNKEVTIFISNVLTKCFQIRRINNNVDDLFFTRTKSDFCYGQEQRKYYKKNNENERDNITNNDVLFPVILNLLKSYYYQNKIHITSRDGYPNSSSTNYLTSNNNNNNMKNKIILKYEKKRKIQNFNQFIPNIILSNTNNDNYLHPNNYYIKSIMCTKKYSQIYNNKNNNNEIRKQDHNEQELYRLFLQRNKEIDDNSSYNSAKTSNADGFMKVWNYYKDSFVTTTLLESPEKKQMYATSNCIKNQLLI